MVMYDWLRWEDRVVWEERMIKGRLGCDELSILILGHIAAYAVGWQGIKKTHGCGCDCNGCREAEG